MVLLLQLVLPQIPQVIGQRLLTGRMAIAEAALVSCRVLHMKTEEYARQKVCNGLAGETSLYSMPQLKSVFDISYRELDRLMRFTAAVEARLNTCLRNGKSRIKLMLSAVLDVVWLHLCFIAAAITSVLSVS